MFLTRLLSFDCCFSQNSSVCSPWKKKKQRVIISIVDFNNLIERQKVILRRDYDLYFSEFLGD